MSSTHLRMSTAELPRLRRSAPGRAGWRDRAGASPSALGMALAAVVLYAAFAHGAVSEASGTRVELAITGLCAVSAICWLWTGTLALAAPRSAYAGIALLVVFGCWCGITVLWSVAPNQTWIEMNRAIAYALVVLLGVAIGSSQRTGLELAAHGFFAVALLVCAYGLGQKLAPGLHIKGVFNLNQTGCAPHESLALCPLPRLQEPIGYWNALALFLAFGVPIALAMAADVTRARRIRLSALCAMTLMLVAISYTYSRGGLLALAAALAVAVSASRQRLRSLMWAACGVLAALPAIVVGLTLHQLTSPAVSLSAREQAGGALAGVLVLSLLALVALGHRLLAVEPRLRLDAARARGLRRLSLLIATTILVGAVAALALSPRGLPGTIAHAWSTFTATHAASNAAPSHLLSADSQNRWVWWKEAAGAFSDRPLGGWGAGSFGVVHLLYRRNALPVQQPHSVPLQFLAETGIVGSLLGVGGFLLLLRGGLVSLRSLAPGRQRLLAAALLAAGVGYGVHSLYDWDWNIPAVSVPVLMFLGVVAGAGGAIRRVSRDRERPLGASLSSRAVALAVVALWLSGFALSVELPALAAATASGAVVSAGSGAPGALARAQSAARLATRLDPLSDEGQLAEANVALHRRRTLQARHDLVAALRTNPTDESAWYELWYVDLLLRDDRGAAAALQRAASLDPYGPTGMAFRTALLDQAPASASPTAIRTPLSSQRSK